MEQPQLTVGIISAGAVGTAVGEAFLRAGHHVHGAVARSQLSRARASERMPNVAIVDVEQAAHAALVVLAVPDPELPAVIEEVAQHTQAGQMVMHTSGALGCEVLQPVTDTGALPLALHPAMTFTGAAEDTDRLHGCGWGVTADSEQGYAVAELLVHTLGGVPVAIPEHHRSAYHAAMAHAANHSVALISDALRMLDYVLEQGDGDDGLGAGANLPPVQNPDSSLLLRKLVHAAVDNALDQRLEGLTGPVAREDAPAVLRHVAALHELGVGLEPYIAMSERTAQMTGAVEIERVLSDYRMRRG
ncbi:DUF2520 domain-containing protein [uncultured Corynebacterium sp.]|uniref:DUF2520 domain-containing protein n=1 Tax=uncultured Corynebacterium sp. TaxID=159447 RepID=UPI0025D6557E|nr:DUF2520 domain-containing protein [uncultured Corynebacterium sp.]